MAIFTLENQTQYSDLALVAIIPEYFNIFILLAVIYGMFCGIEVGHPIYAVLFINLIVPLCATLAEILFFYIIEDSQFFLLLQNFFGSTCLIFHLYAWCVTSVMRYIYIVHENWIHSKIPNIKIQGMLTCTFTVAAVMVILMILISYAASLGELKSSVLYFLKLKYLIIIVSKKCLIIVIYLGLKTHIAFFNIQ